MRQTGENELQAVLRLDGPARFAHFVKRVADSEEAWGLWSNGWALMERGDGTRIFPLWPAREYADLHGTGDWAEYQARRIPLAVLLDELIPKLTQSGVLPGVFPTPGGQGVTPTAGELLASIRKELESYQ